MSALTAKRRTYSSISDDDLMALIQQERDSNPQDFESAGSCLEGYVGSSAAFLHNTSAQAKSLILKWL